MAITAELLKIPSSSWVVAIATAHEEKCINLFNHRDCTAGYYTPSLKPEMVQMLIFLSFFKH